MACENADKLCYRWIMEYDCWRMWKQFAQDGSVDGIANHAGPMWRQDSRYPGNLGDCKTDACRLLVFFMCKISEAANEASDIASEHGVTAQQTSLEAAIDLLDNVSRCFSGVLDSGELRDVQLCLKRHAVLAPLRKNDRTTAKVTGLYAIILKTTKID